MRLGQALQRWFDIRPNEGRIVSISLVSAFLLMAFLILGRSLREALYLSNFPVESLPYITAAVAVLSLPTVSIFTRLLSRYSPRRILGSLTWLVVAGLLLLWPFATRHRAAVILFYLWTALGTLLLASGFWIVTSEFFPVRGAKRLFGLIGAGGTAGALLMGISLSWLTQRIALSWLIIGLAALLLLFWVVQAVIPRPQKNSQIEDRDPVSSVREKMGLLWHDPYLRTLAAIIFVATCASTLVDYQFKEFARASVAAEGELAGFLGAFYGWTGALALLIQLVLASRLIAVAGVAGSLAVLPLFLLLGGAAFLAVPGLLLGTLVRGGDNSLRRSVFRPLLEYLYVPLPAQVRRRTKTFIDLVVDSSAEGFGALLIFLWVTLPGLPSRYLSGFVIVLAIILLLLSRGMGRRYLATITRRLEEGDRMADRMLARDHPHQKDLLSAAFTRMEMPLMMDLAGDDSRIPGGAIPVAPHISADPAPAATTENAEVIIDNLKLLRAPDDRTVVETLARIQMWNTEHMSALILLLARDSLLARVTSKLIALDSLAVPQLAASLRDENTDFVIRRRIPAVFTQVGGAEADTALLEALAAGRFEVRYQAALALVHRRKSGLAAMPAGGQDRVWQALRAEVERERPVWEMQKLLDHKDTLEDDMVVRQVDVRGALSLEHTFRMLTLVLEPQPVRAAFHGMILADAHLKSYALEYLEQVLPADIRQRLWLFIGDVSEHQRRRKLRSLDKVANDLMNTRATLFAGQEERDALRRMLGQSDD